MTAPDSLVPFLIFKTIFFFFFLRLYKNQDAWLHFDGSRITTNNFVNIVTSMKFQCEIRANIFDQLKCLVFDATSILSARLSIFLCGKMKWAISYPRWKKKRKTIQWWSSRCLFLFLLTIWKITGQPEMSPCAQGCFGRVFWYAGCLFYGEYSAIWNLQNVKWRHKCRFH